MFVPNQRFAWRQHALLAVSAPRKLHVGRHKGACKNMSVNEGTRKPIDQLTIEDLDAFPIWEFATGEEEVVGRDETWVRPVNVCSIPLDAFSLSVAAHFVSPNGTQYDGIMEVTTAFESPFPTACLIVRGEYLYIGCAPGSRERVALAKKLGGSEADIFPLKYTLRALVAGEVKYRTGEVV